MLLALLVCLLFWKNACNVRAGALTHICARVVRLCNHQAVAITTTQSAKRLLRSRKKPKVSAKCWSQRGVVIVILFKRAEFRHACTCAPTLCASASLTLCTFAASYIIPVFLHLLTDRAIRLHNCLWRRVCPADDTYIYICHSHHGTSCRTAAHRFL